jgi:hypothetical protein
MRNLRPEINEIFSGVFHSCYFLSDIVLLFIYFSNGTSGSSLSEEYYPELNSVDTHVEIKVGNKDKEKILQHFLFEKRFPKRLRKRFPHLMEFSLSILENKLKLIRRLVWV